MIRRNVNLEGYEAMNKTTKIKPKQPIYDKEIEEYMQWLKEIEQNGN